VICILIVAQWESWLRHSRDDPPSIQELLLDEERKERTRRLAKIADERWITKEQQSVERLPVGSSEEALKGKLFPSVLTIAFQMDRGQKPTDQVPGSMKRNLTGQDPGTIFEPQQWPGKIHGRE
jgi:hypothetical protein